MPEIKNNKCLYCHESREYLKRSKRSCGLTDGYTGELLQEFPRHRFRPWTPKEIAAQESALRIENEYWERASQEPVPVNALLFLL